MYNEMVNWKQVRQTGRQVAMWTGREAVRHSGKQVGRKGDRMEADNYSHSFTIFFSFTFFYQPFLSSVIMQSHLPLSTHCLSSFLFYLWCNSPFLYYVAYPLPTYTWYQILQYLLSHCVPCPLCSLSLLFLLLRPLTPKGNFYLFLFSSQCKCPSHLYVCF